MKLRTRIWLLLLIVLLAIAGFLPRILMHSESASHWAINRVVNSTQGQVSIGSMQGSLAKGLTLHDIRVMAGDTVVEVASLQAKIAVGLFPLAIDVISADARLVIVTLNESDDDTALDIEQTLADLRLPFNLSIVQGRVSDLAAKDDAGNALQRFDSISFSLQWDDAIRVAQMDFSGPDIRASLKGELELHAPFVHDLQFQGNEPEAGVDFAVTLKGDNEHSAVTINSESWQLSLTGAIERLFEPGQSKLEFAVPQLVLPSEQGDPIKLRDLQGVIGGSTDALRLSLLGRIDALQQQDVEFQLAAVGSGSEFEIESLSLQAENLKALARGSLTPDLPQFLQMDVSVEQFSPARLLEEWPAGKSLTGTLKLSMKDDLVLLQDLDLGINDAPTHLQGAVQIDTESGELEADLGWTQLAWPLAPDEALMSSAAGQLQAHGTAQAWFATAQLDLQLADYPGGRFELEAEGDTTSAGFTVFTGEALGGQLEGAGKVNWEEDFAWQAELDIQQGRLSYVVEDWPVVFDTHLATRGDTGDGPIILEMSDLEGAFRGQAFTGSGGIEVRGEGMQFRQVALESGDSRLDMDGDLYSTTGMNFTIVTEAGSWLAAMLGGEFNGQGRLAFGAPQPVLEVEMEASNVSWGELGIAKMYISRPEDAVSPLALAVKAEQLQVAATAVQTATFDLIGDADEQQLVLSLAGQDWQAGFELLGAFSDWADPASGWQGRLIRFHVSEPGRDWLQLHEPAGLVYTAQGWVLEEACLDVISDGLMCLAGGQSEDGTYQLALQVQNLSLQLTELLFEHDLEFSQLLNGELQLSKAAGRAPTGFADFRISPGRFGDEDEGEAMVSTLEGLMGFRIEGGDLVEGNLDIPLGQQGQVDIDFSISDLMLDGTGRLDGRIVVDLNNLEVLDSFVGDLNGLEGRLHSDLRLGGLTSDPEIDGSFKLSNGRFDYPEFGARFSDITLTGQVARTDVIDLRGGFIAGQGHGQIDVLVDFSSLLNPVIEATIKGEELLLLDTPDLNALVNIDLSADWAGESWVVGGTLVVPSARLSPSASLTSKVSESSDVVIVAGKKPGTVNGTDARPVALRGTINATLGDDVSLVTDMAELDLTGAVELAWNDQLLPTGTGAITVNGDLRVFGPVLRVEQGRVRFNGGPASNPLLDIRAERDVFGNTQLRGAGVSVTGTARRPVIEAYTVPLTTRDRAWGVLITGSDFDQGQGVGALDVGTYIAPRIYVAYGLSLFDDQNVFSVRYDLQKGWGVKATSGQRETGLDISYTIER